MSNSLEELLELMKKGSVTLGWGAVAVYSRDRLNRLLEQQYLTRFKENRYLPPFSHTFAGVAMPPTTAWSCLPDCCSLSSMPLSRKWTVRRWTASCSAISTRCARN